jgi:hypothetical protein
MIMTHEDGEINVEGMEFQIAGELQDILERTFTQCIRYQLNENPISVHLYKHSDEPFKVTAQTEAFNNEFLTYVVPLVELIKESIEYEDDNGIQVLRTELQTCMDIIDIRLKEIE